MKRPSQKPGILPKIDNSRMYSPLCRQGPVVQRVDLEGLSTVRDIIDRLPADALRILAREYADIVDAMRLRLAELEQQQRGKSIIDEKRDRLNKAAQAALVKIRHGQNEKNAIFSAASEFSVKSDDVAHFVRRLSIERAQNQRAVRKIETARLARQGLTNQEIADRLGVHRNTVSADLAELRNSVSED